MVSPVELPTKRNSYHAPTTDEDIHDPKWIPLLRDRAEAPPPLPHPPRASSTQAVATLSFMSSTPARPALVHMHSKSSLAPERVVPELDTKPPALPKLIPVSPNDKENVELPAGTPTSHYFERHFRSNDGDGSQGTAETMDTDHTATSSVDRATTGTASSLDDQLGSLPAPQAPKDGAHLPPMPPLSTRTSISLVKHSTGVTPPTSKYNRKALPSYTQSPHASPRITQIIAQPPGQAETPTLVTAPEISSPQISAQHTPSLSHAKSTISQRKQRALQSHPSNPSIKSRHHSSSSESDVPVQTAAAFALPASRPPSSRSRRSIDSKVTSRYVNFDGQLARPTPAPTTPLPQIPPQAVKSSPSVSEDAVGLRSPLKTSPRPHLPAPSPTRVTGDHREMASFMTATQTVVFRRFDEVHVQLLLCLQDEIQQLERDLMQLDGTSMTRNDRTVERTRVLRDLRRVVGEYDHLFASWSSMQANKASTKTKQSLRQWLERPATSAGAALGNGAKEDLAWLESSKDLSHVTMGEKTKVAPSGNGFAGLFGGCTGRQK